MEARTENIIRTSFGTASKAVHASGGSWYKLPPSLPRPFIPTISPPKSTYCEKINPFLSVQFESLHDEEIYIAVGPEVLSQVRPEYGKLFDVMAFAEFFDQLQYV